MPVKQYFPLTLMLVLVLSGCNLPAGTTPNMPDPVATGSPSEAATAPPATAPLPTPTRPPDLIVLEGERDLHNGDWDAAATAFQNVLNNPGATQAERSAAKIGLAQAALEQGDFAMTVSALDQFIAENPDDPRLAQAYFLRGDARLGTSDWAGAIADYEQYLTLRPGVIDSYVHERIGDAYIGLVNYDEALAAYGRALEAPRYLVGELILRERVATLNRSLGNPDAAIAQYNAILDVAQNDGYRASIQFYIAQTLFEAERFPQAYEQFRFVFETYPFRYEAYSS
ncbi:MAG: tetratricopeptide repeat protein, partial [Chloroflexi bacterium]|nr:tetratricopeptide repeat protein [Chloroflexota bacterium]